MLILIAEPRDFPHTKPALQSDMLGGGETNRTVKLRNISLSAVCSLIVDLQLSMHLSFETRYVPLSLSKHQCEVTLLQNSQVLRREIETSLRRSPMRCARFLTASGAVWFS